MRPKPKARPHGQIRQSQVVTSFGPGAMLDLPQHSVLIGGLDLWGDPDEGGFRAIREDRLLAKVRRVLGRDDVRLFAPPVDSAASDAPKTGIQVWRFPSWFVVQKDEVWGENVRSRRLVSERDLVGGSCWIGPDRKRHPVVPVRFVQACANGHISDLDWHWFTHTGTSSCRRKLWIDERGTSGDLAAVFVRCECGASRSLVQALPTGEGGAPLGPCRGKRPWLGAGANEDCGGTTGKALPNRLLLRSASNSYFAQVLSVISIPDSDERLREAVERVWDQHLLYVEDLGDLKKERRRANVASTLEGLSDEAVLHEIQRRKSNATPAEKSIKQAEIETLLAQPESAVDDVPEREFFAAPLPRPASQDGPMKKVDRVVLVHRLREVTAQIGFTRFESAMPDIDGELALDVRRAPLARDANWVPAVENRGEGVLVTFRQDDVSRWLERPAVDWRIRALREGFDRWKTRNSGAYGEFPGPRYILLHSLSHLLIQALSLACGYSASSIRERIYPTEAGLGILLYTGTPDSEGTLGGLVQIGRNIEEHLRAALEMGTLCSNDPVCAQHRPNDPIAERYLHGAACHGCLLIAEPSCERRNDWLDRSLVIPTVEDLGAEFFGEADL